MTTRAAGTGAPGPLRLQAASYRREMPAVKHIGLFGALRCRRTAQREGFDDVLFLNQDGTISEIATSNIGFVRDGNIVWPRSEWLTGITMTLLNQALDEPIRTEPVTLTDLPTMEFVFATNAATGIRPVASVDDQSWPVDHPTLKQLRDLYADIPAEQLYANLPRTFPQVAPLRAVDLGRSAVDAGAMTSDFVPCRDRSEPDCVTALGMNAPEWGGGDWRRRTC